MSKYIVWRDYGSEGWQPSETVDTWEKAIEEWKNAMSLGPHDVVITKVCEMEIREVPDES